MPQAGRSKASTGLEVQVKARRVNIFPSMRKTHRDVRFVGTFVRREADVAVDAK